MSDNPLKQFIAFESDRVLPAISNHQEQVNSAEVIFSFDEAMRVKVSTRIHPDFEKSLIELGYLNEAMDITPEATKLALILAVNETTDTLIENINAEYNDVTQTD